MGDGCQRETAGVAVSSGDAKVSGINLRIERAPDSSTACRQDAPVRKRLKTPQDALSPCARVFPPSFATHCRTVAVLFLHRGQAQLFHQCARYTSRLALAACFVYPARSISADCHER